MNGGLLFYGVQRADAPRPAATTADEAAHGCFCVSQGALRAIMAAPAAKRRAPTPARQAMRAHHQTVLAFAALAPILPGRFNTRFPGGLAQARGWIEARHDRLLARLEAIEGCTEVSWRLSAPARDASDADATSPQDRTAALRGEAEAEARITTAAARLGRAIAPHARAVAQRWRPNASGGLTLVGAVLVPCERVGAVTAAVAAEDAADARLSAAAKGPFPPYSFADIDAPLRAPQPATERAA